jgi:hypothetical protein
LQTFNLFSNVGKVDAVFQERLSNAEWTDLNFCFRISTGDSLFVAVAEIIPADGPKKTITWWECIIEVVDAVYVNSLQPVYVIGLQQVTVQGRAPCCQCP